MEELKMTRRLVKNQSPLFLGMDSFFKDLDSLVEKSTPNYPKFALYQSKDKSQHTIEVAVAGLKTDNISISQNCEKRKITISYDHYKNMSEEEVSEEIQKDRKERTCLHNGISKKSFSLDFMVPMNAEVSSAKIDNGILTVVVDVPDMKDKVKQIEISKI
jgi:molecular chaperone IbpA